MVSTIKIFDTLDQSVLDAGLNKGQIGLCLVDFSLWIGSELGAKLLADRENTWTFLDNLTRIDEGDINSTLERIGINNTLRIKVKRVPNGLIINSVKFDGSEEKVFELVTTSGENQTINGLKTFVNSPIVPEKITNALESGKTSIATETQVFNVRTELFKYLNEYLKVIPLKLVLKAGALPDDNTLSTSWKSALQSDIIPIGATIINLDQDHPHGKVWTYLDYGNSGGKRWEDRGYDSVKTATNDIKGLVKGTTLGDGNIIINENGEMSVIGWSFNNDNISKNEVTGLDYEASGKINLSFKDTQKQKLTAQIPPATITNDGYVTADQIIELKKNTADINTLRGKARRIVINQNFDTPEFADPDHFAKISNYLTKQWWELTDSDNPSSGEEIEHNPTPPDGATVVNLAQDAPRGHTWTYFQSLGNWVDRGTDTTKQSTETDLGTVLSTINNPINNTSKVTVLNDGTLKVIGWDEKFTEVNTNLSNKDIKSISYIKPNQLKIILNDNTELNALIQLPNPIIDASYLNHEIIFTFEDNTTKTIDWLAVIPQINYESLTRKINLTITDNEIVTPVSITLPATTPTLDYNEIDHEISLKLNDGGDEKSDNTFIPIVSTLKDGLLSSMQFNDLHNKIDTKTRIVNNKLELETDVTFKNKDIAYSRNDKRIYFKDGTNIIEDNNQIKQFETRSLLESAILEKRELVYNKENRRLFIKEDDGLNGILRELYTPKIPYNTSHVVNYGFSHIFNEQDQSLLEDGTLGGDLGVINVDKITNCAPGSSFELRFKQNLFVIKFIWAKSLTMPQNNKIFIAGLNESKDHRVHIILDGIPGQYTNSTIEQGIRGNTLNSYMRDLPKNANSSPSAWNTIKEGNVMFCQYESLNFRLQFDNQPNIIYFVRCFSTIVEALAGLPRPKLNFLIDEYRSVLIDNDNIELDYDEAYFNY